MRHLDFICYENKYKLADVDVDNKNILLTINGQDVEFSWEGEVDFYNDNNGAGDHWVSYHDHTIVIVRSVDGGEVPEGFEYSKRFVVQHIATQHHKKLVEESVWNDY